MFDNLIAGMHVGRILPEILIVVVSLAALLADVLLPRERSTRGVQIVTLAGLLMVIAASLLKMNDTGQAFGGLVMVDHYTMFFRLILPLLTIFVIFFSEGFIARAKIKISEYYLMLIFSLFGMMLMVMAQDLLILFLGIETMSISLYALVGISRHKHSSNEGALKYFLLGSFTTGFLLYGIALLYGLTGSTNYVDIMAWFGGVGEVPIMAWAATGLILVAMAFKTALVPFHWWSPDAYEGAPTTVTAFMSTAPKAAAFAALVRLFYVGLPEIAGGWTQVLWVIAVLTMTFGNLLALRQDSVKRMLAFSSITHAGYLVVALLTFEAMGAAAILFYLVVYGFMNIGAFAVAIAVNRNEDDEKGYSFDDYKGLAYRKPWLALGMMVFMLSLAGIPPMAGFFGKYYIFASAVRSGFIWLAVIGVLNSAVSVYYYLRVIVNMFLRDRDEAGEGEIFWKPEMAQMIAVCVILILLIGLFPQQLLNVATASVASLW